MVFRRRSRLFVPTGTIDISQSHMTNLDVSSAEIGRCDKRNSPDSDDSFPQYHLPLPGMGRGLFFRGRGATQYILTTGAGAVYDFG